MPTSDRRLQLSGAVEEMALRYGRACFEHGTASGLEQQFGLSPQSKAVLTELVVVTELVSHRRLKALARLIRALDAAE